jgi:hypothetical protein
MSRTKTIPDAQILAHVRHLLVTEGDKAISFGILARATKLAPSTLAQRFGTVTAMRIAALKSGWHELTEQTQTAIKGAAGKGPQGLLKSLDPLCGQVPGLLQAATDSETRAMANDWRKVVEAALAERLGQGDKAREAAAILFAAWQGQMLWRADDFKIKDAVKRLT